MRKLICSGCNIEKEINLNNFKFHKKDKRWEKRCRVCIRAQSKIYYNKNKEIIKLKNKNYKKQYPEKRKEIIRKSNNKCKIKRQQYNTKYYINNKNIINEKRKIYEKKRLQSPAYKLKCAMSRTVRNCLKKHKNFETIKKYLPYTFNELKIYLESLFEPWMNWNNYGSYNTKTWDDNDSSTWKWNIDHITPQSELLYDSMEHPNFKKCWALENLRPYSAKQNLLDGVNRTRHNKLKT